VKLRIVYKGKKLGDFFRIKDKIPSKHESDLIYAFEPEGEIEYVGETKVRFETRPYEHCFTDKESAVSKHAESNNILILRTILRFWIEVIVIQ